MGTERRREAGRCREIEVHPVAGEKGRESSPIMKCGQDIQSSWQNREHLSQCPHDRRYVDGVDTMCHTS